MFFAPPIFRTVKTGLGRYLNVKDNFGDVVMTASFGVAAISEKDTCLTDVIVRADRALYRSKRAGRNRVDLESSQMIRAIDGSLEPVTSN